VTEECSRLPGRAGGALGLASAALLAAAAIWAHHWGLVADTIVAAWGLATLGSVAASGWALLGPGGARAAAKLGLWLVVLSLGCLALASAAGGAGGCGGA
jgi:hypothetical protein